MWTKTLSEEFWSGVVSPLMFSIAGGLIEERMARKGIRLAGLKNLEKERFFRLFGGQVYLNVKVLEEIVKLIPSVFLTPQMLKFFPKEIQEDFRGIEVAFFSPQTFRLLFRLFGMDRDWAPFFNYKAFETRVAKLEEIRKAYAQVDEERMNIPELLERSRMLCDEMGDYLDVVTWGMVFAYVFHPLTEILAREWAKDRDGALSKDLTVGLEGIKTFEINREIESLAEQVDAAPALKNLFQRRKAKTLLKAMQNQLKSTDFRQGFERFLERHGHRFHGRDILYATWRECPEMVIDMIKINQGSDRSRRAFDQQKKKRQAAEMELRKRVRRSRLGAGKLALFSLSLDYNQKYFVIRENMRYHSDIFLEQFRKLYLEIGRRWQVLGWLKRPEDIVCLSKEEIEEACRSNESMLRQVEKRKKEYRQYRYLKTPEVVTDNTRLQPVTGTPSEQAVSLSGEPASHGFVTGPARVVREPRDILTFQKGEILVAEYTDPSWTPILSMAAGMVIEAGGFLSHGSIVAREYGIPSLIQVEGAMERIQTGDRLELDTEQKCVRIERV